MPSPSFRESGLNANPMLTTLAQAYLNPNRIATNFFPIAESADYAGQIMRDDDSLYETVEDDRDDDTPYTEIHEGFSTQAFILRPKGFKIRYGDKRARRLGLQRVSIQRRAPRKLMQRATLNHEVEALKKLTDFNLYQADCRKTLTVGTQLNDIDPGPLFREINTRVASFIGGDPNVLGLSRYAADAIANNPYVLERFKYTSRESVTTDMIAALYGYERVVVSNALVKDNTGKAGFAMGAHMIAAHVNPQALAAGRLPYRTDGEIDPEEASFGYTMVYPGNPVVKNPIRNEEDEVTIYKLEFDREIVITGTNERTGLINHGCLVLNAARP